MNERFELHDDPIAADEAWRIGLVNRVVPAASLMIEARALAQSVAAKAPIAVRYILDAVAVGLEMSLPDAQDYEATLFGLVSGLIAGLFGIGGGFIKGPLMVLGFGIPARIAAPTALFMIVITSAVGSTSPGSSMPRTAATVVCLL